VSRDIYNDVMRNTEISRCINTTEVMSK